jgi:transcriptional regulator GlxA family with amidase domain
MTHVAILVPQGSVLVNSVLGLFKVFHLANQRSIQAGRGLAFDLHLVGATARTDLYGDQFLVHPDLTMADVTTADLAIIPAMAGNIAAAIHNNSVFLPWLKRQYHAGCAIAGLCTGGVFVVETGLMQDEHCTGHWFVDATFRKQYSQMNVSAERTAHADDSIHSDGGAWSFLHEVVERSVDREAASTCSASFQNAFNRECQSVLAVYDRRQHTNQSVRTKPISANRGSSREMTVERFVSLFESKNGREGGSTIADLLEESLRMPIERSDLQASKPWLQDEEESRADHHNARTFKALFKKIERVDTSYSHG